MISERRRRAPVVLVLLVGVGVGVAQPARAGGGDTDEQARVQALIKDAVAEYDAGHFQEARALFRRAQAESPSARTLRGIGMASFELRDYVEATRALSAALRETRHALTPEQRGHVDGLLARAEAFVGRFTIRVEPADATLLVDGRPPEPEPDGSLLLSFGNHQITARCPTCAAAEQRIEILGGERKSLTIALRPAASGGAGADTGGKNAPIEHPPEPAGGGRATALWLTGAAAVAAAGAVAAALWWRDRSHELDFCRANGADCGNQGTLESQRNVGAAMTVGLGVAAVAAGVAAAITWPRQAPATRALACAPASTLDGVSCALTF